LATHCGKGFYDDILRLDVPERAQLVGFADDVAILAVAQISDALDGGLTPHYVVAIDSWM